MQDKIDFLALKRQLQNELGVSETLNCLANINSFKPCDYTLSIRQAGAGKDFRS
jgi:hypothetical protein